MYEGKYAVAADNTPETPTNRRSGFRFRKPNVKQPLYQSIIKIQ